jgi:hypothetical protein
LPRGDDDWCVASTVPDRQHHLVQARVVCTSWS